MKKMYFKPIFILLLSFITLSTTFSNPFDVPSRPSGVYVDNSDKEDRVNVIFYLKWDVPEDNGSRIIYYIVETRTANAPRWVKVGKTEVPGAKVDVTSSIDNYIQFRIIAVNAAGNSRPSEPTDPYYFY